MMSIRGDVSMSIGVLLLSLNTAQCRRGRILQREREDEELDDDHLSFLLRVDEESFGRNENW